MDASLLILSATVAALLIAGIVIIVAEIIHAKTDALMVVIQGKSTSGVVLIGEGGGQSGIVISGGKIYHITQKPHS